jgi:hypothetical protein
VDSTGLKLFHYFAFYEMIRQLAHPGGGAGLPIAFD